MSSCPTFSSSFSAKKNSCALLRLFHFSWCVRALAAALFALGSERSLCRTKNLRYHCEAQCAVLRALVLCIVHDSVYHALQYAFYHLTPNALFFPKKADHPKDHLSKRALLSVHLHLHHLCLWLLFFPHAPSVEEQKKDTKNSCLFLFGRICSICYGSLFDEKVLHEIFLFGFYGSPFILSEVGWHQECVEHFFRKSSSRSWTWGLSFLPLRGISHRKQNLSFF